MRIKIRPGNHNITLEIGFAQKDRDSLEKLWKAIGIKPSRDRTSSRHQIVYSTPKLDSIISILDKADPSDWFTVKYEDYKHFKEALRFVKQVRARKTFIKWHKKDIEELLKIRKKLKHIRTPWNKLPDEEILKGWTT